MFRNLEAEMARKGITKGDVAKFLGVRYGTIIGKAKGRSQFSLAEAFKIKDHFFPDQDFEYLFKQDNQSTA